MVPTDTQDQFERTQRWQAEAEFFDEWAERSLATVDKTDPAVLSRYRQPGRLFHKEFRLNLLGNLAGRRILDVGCGDGANSVLLAELGAIVTGIDISPKAIEVAQRRAEIAGVEDRCTFICSPLETAPPLEGTFDVIWGDAILHHVLADLDTVLQRLVSWTRPGGILVFSEPINLAAWLRRVRMSLPVHTDATPDERPLESSDLAIVGRHLPDMVVQPFHLFSRLNRFVLLNYSYERSPGWRKWVAKELSRLDALLFKMPPLRSLAGYAVIYGHRPVEGHR